MPPQPANASLNINWNLSGQPYFGANGAAQSGVIDPVFDWQLNTVFDFDNDDFGLVQESELKSRVVNWEKGDYALPLENIDVEYDV